MSLAVILPLVAVMQQADGQTQLAQIKARAIEAVRVAEESMRRAKGEGKFEFRRSMLMNGRVKDVVVERGTFSMAYSAGRDFIKFQMDSPNSEYDARVFVNDGGAVLGSYFSPRVRPYGADGMIYGLAGECGNPDLFGVAPHYFARAWANLEQLEKAYGDAPVTLQEEGGQYVIRITGTSSGWVVKIFIDPARGYHVTRFLDFNPSGLATRRVEKDWAKTESGLWYVRRFVQEEIPDRDMAQGESWKFEFGSFEPNIDIPDELFTVDALGLPAGARIIDTRSNESFIVKPPKTDVAVLEKIVGQLPKAAFACPTPPKSFRFRWWLLITNIGLLLLITGFVVHRAYRSRMGRA